MLCLPDKRGIDGRLTSAQTALMMQEETIRRNERERKVLSDKVSTLERALAAAESEKRQLQVSFFCAFEFQQSVCECRTALEKCAHLYDDT